MFTGKCILCDHEMSLGGNPDIKVYFDDAMKSLIKLLDFSKLTIDVTNKDEVETLSKFILELEALSIYFADLRQLVLDKIENCDLKENNNTTFAYINDVLNNNVSKSYTKRTCNNCASRDNCPYSNNNGLCPLSTSAMNKLSLLYHENCNNNFDNVQGLPYDTNDKNSI